MTDQQIIDEAKTMAMFLTDESAAWRGSNTKKVFDPGLRNSTDKNDEVRRVRVLFGQAFRCEI